MAESKPTLEAKDFIEAKTSKELFSIMNTIPNIIVNKACMIKII